MSFKYRFILSFVLLEMVFILLIVSVNFWAIQNSSERLIQDKIKSNITFLDQLLKVPLSIFDLATLDNLVESTRDLDYINSIVVLDAQNNVLSKQYEFKHESLNEFLKDKMNRMLTVKKENYAIRYEKLMVDEVFLGSMFLVFDVSDNQLLIEENKYRTMLIVALEILVSTLLSFVIGSRLTVMLENLSEVATHIGEAKEISIPYQDKKDEIGTLSRSMKQMRVDLRARNDKLRGLALELTEQKNELIAANKSKDDFLANMSHELKTPLNSINVISSVMMKNRKQELTSEQVKNLKVINNCGNDLLFLINDVLDISKLEAGEVELNYETIDFHEMMGCIRDMIAPQIKEKNLELVYECDESIQYIYSDRNRIKQIIKNLLSNALKFTQEGHIFLTAISKDKDVFISVQDEGIGIPSSRLEHIFERFKQVDGSTTRKYGGTGLGLAICKELCVLLGGYIDVNSVEKQGTTFNIRIPQNAYKVQIPESKEETVPKIEEKEITKSKPTLVEKEEIVQKDNNSEHEVSHEKKQKVLLLNNDPIAFMGLVVMLNKEVILDQVSNLEQALIQLKNEAFDAFVMDLKDITSVELEEVQTLELPKVILVNSEDMQLNEALQSKVSAVFVKPFDKNALLEKILI